MEHPGLELEKRINECGMSRKELALRTGVTEKHISTVINGERGISTGFARKLGYVFPKAQDWLRLQNEYDQEQLQIKDQQNITEDELAVLKPLHDITQYFIEQQYMHNNCGDVTKVMQLRSLLNISNLTSIPQITYNAAYRVQLSKNIRVNPYVLFAWQRLCEKKTENITVRCGLDKDRLRDSLPDIKSMMFGKIDEGVQLLQECFASCGIAFQVVKNFRGAPVQGFIKESANNKIILCLTIRGKRADTFWFTLFHEIGHVLNGDLGISFKGKNEEEEEADLFARNILIPQDQYENFIRLHRYFDEATICKFASSIKRDPGIVLGRLLKDEKVLHSDGDLSKKLRHKYNVVI